MKFLVQELLHQLIGLPLVTLPVALHPKLAELRHKLLRLALLAPGRLAAIQVGQLSFTDLLCSRAGQPQLRREALMSSALCNAVTGCCKHVDDRGMAPTGEQACHMMGQEANVLRHS